MEKSDVITVLCMFKAEAQMITDIENGLSEVADILSFKHLPDTTELYKTDKEFKKLVDNKSNADKSWRAYLNSLPEEY